MKKQSEKGKTFKKIIDTALPGAKGGLGILSLDRFLKPAYELEKYKDREEIRREHEEILDTLDKLCKKTLQDTSKTYLQIVINISMNQKRVDETKTNTSYNQKFFTRDNNRFTTEKRFEPNVRNDVDETIGRLDLFNDPEWGYKNKTNISYVCTIAKLFFMSQLIKYYPDLDYIILIQRKGEAVYKDILTDFYDQEKVIRDVDLPLPNISIMNKNILFFDDSIVTGSTARKLIDYAIQQKAKNIFVMCMVSTKTSLKNLKEIYPNVIFLIPEIFILPDDYYSGFYREIMFPYFESLCQPMDTDHLMLELSFDKRIEKDKLLQILKDNITADVYLPLTTINDPETFKVTIQYTESIWDKWKMKNKVDSIECTKVRIYVNNHTGIMYINPIVNPIFSEYLKCESVRCSLKLEYCLKEMKNSNLKLNDNIDRDCITYNFIIPPLNEVFDVLKTELKKENITFTIKRLSYNDLERNYGKEILNPIKKLLS